MSGILFVNFGPKYAIVAAATVGTYTVFTVKVSKQLVIKDKSLFDLHMKFPCVKIFTIDLHMQTPLELR